jgi:large-conductance mechanosensitive channel
MPKKSESQDEESAAFNRRFKYAIIAYAIIEFIVIAFVVYYKTMR